MPIYVFFVFCFFVINNKNKVFVLDYGLKNICLRVSISIIKLTVNLLLHTNLCILQAKYYCSVFVTRKSLLELN